MKIFVTGGTGFIGSHFLSQVLRLGHKVVALKRNHYSETKIPLLAQPLWLEKGMNSVTEDDFEGCNILVHLAAHSANFPYDTLENCIKYNVLEPLSLFNIAKNAGVKKVLVAGSCFEYGTSGEKFDFIPTDAPLEPTNTYSTSKAMASLAFKNFSIENNIILNIQRIFQVYGNGEPDSRLWPSLRKAAINGEDFQMTKGEQIRDFINVEDVAKKLLQACMDIGVSENSNCFSINNLGSGNPTSIYEFSKFWWTKWEAKGQLIVGSIPYRSGEVMRFVPQI